MCPPGFKCPTKLYPPIKCLAGTIATGGSLECAPCPLNYQCPYQQTMSRCPLYHYSPLGEQECSPCPNGKTCQDPALPPQDCPPGQYSETLDAVCKLCPIGHFCPGASATYTKCPAGTYANSLASVECTTCYPGFYSKMGFEFC